MTTKRNITIKPWRPDGPALEVDYLVSREAVVNAPSDELALFYGDDHRPLGSSAFYAFQAAGVVVRANTAGDIVDFALVKDARVHGAGDNSAETDEEAIEVARPRLEERLKAAYDRLVLGRDRGPLDPPAGG